MSVIFNNLARPSIPRLLNALQRLEDAPEQLAREREHRYDDPPPPYSVSGETTQPPTPGPPDPPLDDFARALYREEARGAANPLNQFDVFSKRECERLRYQYDNIRYGRRETLPYDPSMIDPLTNAENNVRSRWVEQGIWGDNWGPSWPKGSVPSILRWESDVAGPFAGSFASTHENGYAGACWAHEEPQEEPQSESESTPEPPKPRRQTRGNWGIFGSSAPSTPPPEPEPEPKRPCRYLTLNGKPKRCYCTPLPIVPNLDASRPYHQFKYQVAKELEWVRDEWVFKNPGVLIPDLRDQAHKSIKDFWIEENFWNKKWGEEPGMKWIYEEPDEEENEGEEADAEPNRSQLPATQSQPFSSEDVDRLADQDNENGHPGNSQSHNPLENEETLSTAKRVRGRPRQTAKQQQPAPSNAMRQGDTPRRSTRGRISSPQMPRSSKRKRSELDAINNGEAAQQANKRPKRAKTFAGPLSAANPPRRSSRIIDKQEEAAAKRPISTVPPNSAAPGKSQRRGRPRKSEAIDTTSTPNKRGRGRPKKTIDDNVSSTPKKRGRPKKTVGSDAASVHKKRGRPKKAAENAISPAPKKRGRPRKTGENEIVPIPKKRGRPKKTIDESLPVTGRRKTGK